MNKQSVEHTNSDDTQFSTSTPWDAYKRAALMIGICCFGFTAVASWILVIKLQLIGFHEEGLAFNLLLKALFFSVMLFGCLWIARRHAPRLQDAPQPEIPTAETTPPRLLYGVAIVLLLAMVYPNLSHYPWTAPDELHHLIVARNLAEHHAYASGNPEIGFTYFDHYDSVGVPVLGSIALAFKFFGTSLVSARIVLASSYLLLALGVFCFIRRHWDTTAALVSLITMTFTFGSIYLARSLYGEVSALMFLVWSMHLWGKSFDSSKIRSLSTFAGILWGLAVLAKTFMLLSAFPIMAVWLYDRLSTKRIRWEQVVFPAVGALVVLGLWEGIRAHYSYLVPEDMSMLVYYRHYLMFGLGSLSTPLAWFISEAPLTLSLIFTVLVLIPCLVGRHDNPAVWVLLLCAFLYLYWWLCFTPGTIARYMWYSCAIIGMFSGPILRAAWVWIHNRDASTAKRAFCGLISVSIVAPCLITGYHQAQLIYFNDEAADERNLAVFVAELPEGMTIGSSYWPATLSMDFMANRRVDFIEDLSRIDDKYAVIIYNTDHDTPSDAIKSRSSHFGRYVVEQRDHSEGSEH